MDTSLKNKHAKKALSNIHAIEALEQSIISICKSWPDFKPQNSVISSPSMRIMNDFRLFMLENRSPVKVVKVVHFDVGGDSIAGVVAAGGLAAAQIIYAFIKSRMCEIEVYVNGKKVRIKAKNATEVERLMKTGADMGLIPANKPKPKATKRKAKPPPAS